MVNDSIRIGLVNDAFSLRRLSLLSYNQLARHDSPSRYKLCAISRAAGILAARNKSARRGLPTRTRTLSDSSSSHATVSRLRTDTCISRYREVDVSAYP